jgi:tetratricopeptide (TPR) repeat protein
MLLALLLAQSRNAYLALLVAAAFRLAWGRIGTRPVAVAIAALAVLPFAMLTFRSEVSGPITTWIAALDEVSKSGPSADESWLIRLELWDAATDLMLDYPAIGAGLYAFEASSRLNYPYRLARPTFAFSHAHNGFLQLGVSLGWGGWLGLISLWIVVLHSLREVGKDGQRDEMWLPPALSTSVVAMLVFNTFDVLALEQRAGLLLWLLLALAAAVGVPLRLARRIWWAPVALAAVLFVPAGTTNLARLQLDRARLSDAPLPTVQELADDPRRLGVLHFLAGDMVSARQAWRQDPEAVPYLTAQGRWAMAGAADPAAAVAWYTQALALDAAATEAYLGRGEAYEALGDTHEAMVDYQAAAANAQIETPGGILLAAMAWERQGRLYAQWSEWEAAANAFALAVELVPEQRDYRQQLQDILELLAP